jgi:hypothetical protein
MQRYYTVGFTLTILALCIWGVCSAVYSAPAATDGNGPDGIGLLIYVSTFPVGLLLIHSTLLAWALSSRSPHSVFSGRLGLRIHAALWVAFVTWILFVFGSF